MRVAEKAQLARCVLLRHCSRLRLLLSQEEFDLPAFNSGDHAKAYAVLKNAEKQKPDSRFDSKEETKNFKFKRPVEKVSWLGRKNQKILVWL
ncbi:hypothetical protein VNO80_23465 [Phaseolus coccineus]|uniref:Uncharacterized protein n=1 Tax=Phaseolus coccineus TaxID=3886 RepID=A0AAN9MBA4_PHACN